MEDLGEAIENFVETFSCTEEKSSRLPEKAIPSTHGNLLAASALYGHLFAAVGSSIVIYSNASLREGNANPVAVVDLKEEGVTSIHALAIGAHDTIIAQITVNSTSSIVILNIPALVADKIHAFPGPSGIVRAFSASDAVSKGTSQVLATLEATCVQLHAFATDGVMPTTKINTSNARCIAVSPGGDLVAVGTERGCVIVYAAKSGEKCAKIVEVESGWVPFSMHFADNRSVLVSYICETEVRHVVWHLSPEGDAVTGHSPLGELCLALVSFDDDEPNEASIRPMMTYISLHDWNMCVIGSSMSSDVEIIRKTDKDWEVWKFDEGKSPTLPTDDRDDDTCCVGLAFDLNNTAHILGSDAASPKINPMPRVIVYTSDSLLMPFTLIDSNPGVTCNAIDSAVGFPRFPVILRSIRSASSASLARGDAPSAAESETSIDSALHSKDPFSLSQKDNPSSPRKRGEIELLRNRNATKESAREEQLDITAEDSIQQNLSRANFGLMNAEQSRFPMSNFGSGSRGTFSPEQEWQGLTPFLDKFSFKDASKEHTKPTPGFSSHDSTKSGRERFGRPTSTAVQKKPSVSLAPSLDAAEAEADGGDLFSLLKSIITEMSEELRVSAEAEQIVSQEIAVQKDSIVSSIAETRKQLTKLLQVTRALFQNEATLRNTVSSTLSKVLSLSREYEKMSLEFHVKEADGFSRSLRTEDKEIDDKIGAKEAEVLRSISSIEDRLNAEAEIRTQRRHPAELVQQVYSSLSLQGIRIKRVRSLLGALSERMDNQDKGGRLSHLGLSLARLEKLNINDDNTRDRSQDPDQSKRRESIGKRAVGTPNNVNGVSPSHATNSQGDDTQLLPSDVRAVMRRLAMSGGRADISVAVPLSRTKRGRVITMKEEVSAPDVINHQTTALTEKETANFAAPDSSNAAAMGIFGQEILDLTTTKRNGDFVKTERRNASEMFLSSTGNGMSAVDKDKQINSSSTSQPEEQAAHFDFTIPSSGRSLSTSEADGVPSASLPPKKPPGQNFLPLSTQKSSVTSSLLGSTTFRDMKQKDTTEITPEPSRFPSAKGQDSGVAKIADENTTKEKDREGSPSSKAETFSTRVAGVEAVSSRGVFGIQVSNRVSSQGQASSKANLSSVTPVADVEKPTESGAAQFAQLPLDDGEDMKKSSGAGFASQVANLPPDDDDAKPKTSITALTPIRVKKAEASKNVSMSGFFAALPPDSDSDGGPTPKSNDAKLEKPFVLQTKESEKATSVSETFAALPPDNDTGEAEKQVRSDSSKAERRIFLFDNSSLGSLGGPSSTSAKKESLRTSDLFAALPPDDSRTEQVQPTHTVAGSPFNSGAKRDLKVREGNLATTPAVQDENGAKGHVDRPKISTFGDGSSRTTTGHSQTSPFSLPFGDTQQSAAAFGNTSLFGASSPANQSAPPASTSAPERQSSRDGTSSDESEEESRRFGGGMDTSSGGGGFFGASSPAQGMEGFGFGSKLDNASGAMTFGQSSVSPFGSLSQSQLFEQSTLAQPPAHTGFGAFAGSQGSAPSTFQPSQPEFEATSAFGVGNASPAFGMDSTFGADSQLGGSSSFGMPSQLGMGSTSFPSSNPTFGSGMPEPKFGESSFGVTSSFGNFAQNATASGFGNSSSASSASPFGNVTGGGFGGASGGGSGFAALAGGQNGSLVFGNGGGPPSFTSAAFSQRRA